jgi:hypothetical protein
MRNFFGTGARRILPASALLAALAGCGSCARPAAPDRHAVEALPDPYTLVPVRGAVTDEERAVAVIAATAKALHYGAAPAEALQGHTNEAWRRTLVLLLAKGDEPQLRAAWEVLSQGFVASEYLPVSLRFEVRKAQARIWDLQNAKVDPALMKRACLAEIAWALYGLQTAPKDAGSR